MAYAQTATTVIQLEQNVPGIVDQIERSIDQNAPAVDAESSPLPDNVIDFATQKPPPNATSLEFVLTDLVIEGASVLPMAELRAVYAELIGQKITLQDAFEIVNQLQALHRNAGFLFTRVIAPPQAIDNGVFRVSVIEAVIGKVVVEQPQGDIGATKVIVEQIAQSLQGKSNPTIQQLERALLLINDVPGITRSTAVPRAGITPGAVDLFVNVVRDPSTNIFFADNRQTPVLGPGFFGLSREAASYSAHADTTKVSWFNSFGKDLEDLTERNTLQLEHQRNFGKNGTTVQARVIASRTAHGDVLEPIDLQGRQLSIEAVVEHPYVRTRPLSIWAYTGIGFNENNLTSLDVPLVEESVRNLKVGGRLLQRDRYGYTRTKIELRQGLDVFGASDRGDANLSRADGVSNATVLRLELEREVFVPKTQNKLSVHTIALVQFSADGLSSGEEFGVGGSQIGRAFDPSEITGDSGYGIAWELRYRTNIDVKQSPIGVQLYGYGDHGEIYNDGLGQQEQANISSYGGGVRLNFVHDLTLAGEIAIPTTRLQRTPDESITPRLFFNVAKIF